MRFSNKIPGMNSKTLFKYLQIKNYYSLQSTRPGLGFALLDGAATVQNVSKTLPLKCSSVLWSYVF